MRPATPPLRRIDHLNGDAVIFLAVARFLPATIVVDPMTSEMQRAKEREGFMHK
jgi:hypothetical protein